MRLGKESSMHVDLDAKPVLRADESGAGAAINAFLKSVRTGERSLKQILRRFGAATDHTKAYRMASIAFKMASLHMIGCRQEGDDYYFFSQP
jgi:hypothetical protein